MQKLSLDCLFFYVDRGAFGGLFGCHDRPLCTAGTQH